MGFIQQVKKRLYDFKKPVRIVFPEGTNPNVLKAASLLGRERLVKPLLLFEKRSCVPTEINNTDFLVIEELDTQKYAKIFFELRKNKGLSWEKAQELVKKPNYLAPLLVKSQVVDGEVCGVDYTTRDTLRPALQILKTKPGTPVVSSLFVMSNSSETLLFGDCAINLSPTSPQIAAITRSMIDFAQKVTNFPTVRVALLSYSTQGSGVGDSPVKVREAFDQLRCSVPEGVSVFGEIQFDAAYNLEVMRKKVPKLKWKKPANVFVFPNLDAGNIGYKMVQRLGKYSAVGPIILGMNGAVNDMSRGASVNDIVGVSYVTSAQFLMTQNEGKL